MVRVLRRPGSLAILGLFLATIPLLGAEDEKERSPKSLAQAFAFPGGKKFDEARQGPNMYQAKLTTADSFNKVAAWYSNTLEFNALEGIAFNPGQKSGIRLSV